MRRVRGRFDIVVPFSDGDAYVRFKSDSKRSLPATEILKCLREYAGYLDAGIREEAAKKKTTSARRTPGDRGSTNDGTT